jgi:hypothetical protein
MGTSIIVDYLEEKNTFGIFLESNSNSSIVQPLAWGSVTSSDYFKRQQQAR